MTSRGEGVRPNAEVDQFHPTDSHCSKIDFSRLVIKVLKVISSIHNIEEKFNANLKVLLVSGKVNAVKDGKKFRVVSWDTR